MSTYNPYGLPGGIPAYVGGVADGGALRLQGLIQDAITQTWSPVIKPGRYALETESDFRYQFAQPQQIALPTDIAGEQLLNLELPFAGFNLETLALSPILVCDGAGTPFTPVCQNVRFGIPIPAASGSILNTIPASGLVDSVYLLDPSNPNQITGLSGSDLLWWIPTFGASVLEVRRSQDARSFDVLADPGALLYPVETPDRLQDDRSYCVDTRYGLVYGRVPANNLPPPPFSSGTPAATYITLAYPTESDGALESNGISNEGIDYYQAYLEANTSFYTAFAGTPATYNPLRLEEIAVVDTDGRVRLRHTGLLTDADLDGTYGPSAVFLAPSGFISLQTGAVSGNTCTVSLPDPSQDNVLAPVPYGTTVLVHYWLQNSFCLEALSGSPQTSSSVTAHLRLLTQSTAASGTGTFTYETDPGGYYCPGAVGPDLDSLNTGVQTGFLWLEDRTQPVPMPVSISGKLTCTTLHPYYDATSEAGEEFTVLGAALDSTGTVIPGAPLLLTGSDGLSIIESAASGNLNGESFFRVLCASGGLQTLTLLDGRTSGSLTTVQIYPAVFRGASQTWEPSVFVCLGEDYPSLAGSSTNTQQYLRVAVLNPDGFPWGKSQSPAHTLFSPGTLVLTSQLSQFSDPNGGNVNLGSTVTVSYNSQSDLLLDSGLLAVVYTPIPGDTLTACFYVGSDKYESAPIVVS